MMRRLGLLIILIFLLAGCSNKKENTALVSQYETLINEQQETILELEKELEQIKAEYELMKRELADYTVGLQFFDINSRKIMQLIYNNQYEKLKKDYNVEFEVKDGSINFTSLKDAPFPVALAGLPMSFAFYNKQPESTEIGYYLDDNDKRYLVAFLYGKDNSFKHIFLGDI